MLKVLLLTVSTGVIVSIGSPVIGFYAFIGYLMIMSVME